MRPYFVRSVALFVAVCFLATCEGSVGPTGPTGPAGADGATEPTGPNGPAEIVNYTADLNEANVTVPTGSIATGTASLRVS